ncbi:MAG TPA: hypothetical protein VF175_15495 [Lacipirellula sp.]
MSEAADNHEGAVFETRKDAGPGAAGEVRLWLEAINLASKDEEKWRKAADECVKLYRDAEEKAQFNILHANTETIIPAVYNSPPVPDIRRRFGDEDPVGKIAGQVAERAVSYMADQYDLDAAMRAAVRDALLPGRGVTRIRFKPVEDDSGQSYPAVCAEHVQWQDFRRGPGRRWDDVPWVAFRHLLTREQVKQLNAEVGATIPLDTALDGADKDNPEDNHDVFKRLLVWEIWDKDKKELLFIAPSYKVAPLLKLDDQLKLEGFFPVPRPLYAVETTDSLVPVEPYRLYKKQAEELDLITRRIKAITRVIKWRGLIAGTENGTALASLEQANDGELVPAESMVQFLQGGGLDKAIWLMPIEQAQKVLDGLLLAREQVKQTIYEITGIADILRGSTEASETATAQQIKAQWGSLRIQRMQAEVARYARDLIRMMVEVVATRFEWPHLAEMTQTGLPTRQEQQQARAQLQQVALLAQQSGAQPPAPPPEIVAMLESPAAEDVEAVLRSDLQRCYRIDVETDSTVRADVGRQQENLSNFILGFGQFIEAVGPAVQAGVMQVDEATDLLTGFARVFKLGRQAEDALDRLGRRAQEMAKNPQPAPPDPEQQKIELERERMGMERQEREARLAMEREKLAGDMQLAQAKQQQEFALAQQKARAEEQRAQMQMQAEREARAQEMQFKEREFGLREQEAIAKVGLEAAKVQDGQKARQESYQREDAMRRAEGLPPGTYEEDVKEVMQGLLAMAQAIQAQTEALNANTQAQAEQTAMLMKAMTAPKRVIRGKSGRAEGVETVLQ